MLPSTGYEVTISRRIVTITENDGDQRLAVHAARHGPKRPHHDVIVV
jgi:hypothetical protein